MMKQKIEVGEVKRPPANEPLQRLKVTVTPSLQKALEKCLQQMEIESKTGMSWFGTFLCSERQGSTLGSLYTGSLLFHKAKD